jgi:hypothetical protein
MVASASKVVIPSSLLDRIKVMRTRGTPWKTIETETGYSYFIIKSNLDPDFAEKQAIRSRELRGERRAAPPQSDRRPRAGIAEPTISIEEIWRSLPRDTRGFTARVCGDPLPGRSALDQKKHPPTKTTPKKEA